MQTDTTTTPTLASFNGGVIFGGSGDTAPIRGSMACAWWSMECAADMHAVPPTPLNGWHGARMKVPKGLKTGFETASPPMPMLPSVRSERGEDRSTQVLFG